MIETERIYADFKKNIKISVQSAKINTIASNGGLRANYLFGVESANDKLYFNVLREMEVCACREIDKLLYNLCEAYGYEAEMPYEVADYDISIIKNDEVFKVELKTAPNYATPSATRRAAMSKDIIYVYLLKQTKESYELVTRSLLNGYGTTSYLFEDFIRLIFGEEEMQKFKKAVNGFTDEMRILSGYQITQICNDTNLNELRQQLKSDIPNFNYEEVRGKNSGSKVIYDDSYAQIKTEFQNTYTLLLGNSDYAVSFLTSEWLYKQFIAVPTIDNTYIVEGYFKSIEQLLWKIIYCVGKGRSIGKSKNIIGGNIQGIDTTLGSLSYFLKDDTNNDLYNSAFGKSAYYVRKYLGYQLDKWIRDCRNGYFHKHNLQDAEKVKEIRGETYYLYFLILGSISLSETDKEMLMN